MGLAARFGQSHLFLPLAQRGHFLIRERAIAARTGYPVFEMWMRAVFSTDRMAAGMAELIVAHFEPMPDADALIKDKALTFPEAFIARHGFEIFQDPALQMEDIINAE